MILIWSQPRWSWRLPAPRAAYPPHVARSLQPWRAECDIRTCRATTVVLSLGWALHERHVFMAAAFGASIGVGEYNYISEQ